MTTLTTPPRGAFVPTSEATAVVRHTTGFQRDWEFVAEATTTTPTGDFVTVREFGHTPEGAVARAQAAARSRVSGLRRAAGFTAEGFRTETRRADFPMGFSA